MNPSLLFLLGAVLLALLGSLLVRLVTHPRAGPVSPNEVQKALRKLSRHRPRRAYGPEGVRLIGRDEPADGPISGTG